MTDPQPSFDPGTDEDDEDYTAPKESSSMAELRKAYNREEKARKGLEKEVEELRTFRHTVVEDQRDTATVAAFKEVGLPEGQARLFKALNPEIDVSAINAEAVARFAADNGLLAVSGEQITAPDQAPSGYTPVVSQEASSAVGTVSREEWIKMGMSDPAKARKAYEDGRVDLSGLRDGLGRDRDE